MKTTIKHSIRSLLLIPLVIACFGLLPATRAQLVPAPDGGYPGNNTAEGTNALFNLTTGINNTAVGANALFHDTTGGYNAAFGSRALENNITGAFNMAVGTQALFNNTASTNLAVGFRTLFFNTTGHDLTGVGAGALFKNTTGAFNTAIGAAALNSNTIGASNTATGRQALLKNITGSFNTANGVNALQNNVTGSNNTGLGVQALDFNTAGSFNTAIGFGALDGPTGSFNTALGFNSGINLTTGSFNIDIGNVGVPAESSTIRIGNSVLQIRAFIAGIRGVTTGNANAVNVVIDSDGQLGTVSSSRRYKKEVKAMEQASEAILGLKPVTFHYKSDSTGTPQFGLIAEEVAEVNPDLVVRDENGEIYTVRYDAVNAMLLNEFLKEHCKVEKLTK